MKSGALAWVCHPPRSCTISPEACSVAGVGTPQQYAQEAAVWRTGIAVGRRQVLEISPALVEKLQADLLCKRNI